MTADVQSSYPADLVPAGADVDGRSIATLRLLAADAVEAAGCGHPGLPMGMAPAAWVLWSRLLRFDPSTPDWADRDRFVLSAGHGSMLLYGLLHLTGHDLTLDDLRQFRQYGSRTPGHPEYGETPGVETTTGPLGQGLATAVGMALGERLLASRFNEPDHPAIVDHRTWVLASDGDLQEGVSHEAASLAGHLGLGRLIVLYDDNEITIDGSTALSCSDDVVARFRSYGWHVGEVDDGNDLDAVDRELRCAMAEVDRPSLVRVSTTIGFGAPDVEGTSGAHGAPLGQGQLRATRARFGFAPDEDFVVPTDVGRQAEVFRRQGEQLRNSWERDLAAWEMRHPELAREWHRRQCGELPEIDAATPGFQPGDAHATRTASGRILAAVSAAMPELVGGSADLAGSTKTALVESTDVTRHDQRGQRINFGIREHAMAAACNGMALHGGLRPYGATFAVFSDYARPAMRLAALMGLPVTHILTHDSVAVGEDGPTHQPVEHLAALRAVPGLAVLRPADANETVAAWQVALRRVDGPTVLVLTRQPVPVLPSPPTDAVPDRGAWIVRDTGGRRPDVVLVGTGSEVGLAVDAADLLAADDIAARVVSMPWRERFQELPPDDAAEILPPGVPRVVVEAGVIQGWEGILGPHGRFVGMTRFGRSAPGPELLRRFGFTPQSVASAARGASAHVREAGGRAKPAPGGELS